MSLTTKMPKRTRSWRTSDETIVEEARRAQYFCTKLETAISHAFSIFCWTYNLDLFVCMFFCDSPET